MTCVRNCDSQNNARSSAWQSAANTVALIRWVRSPEKTKSEIPCLNDKGEERECNHREWRAGHPPALEQTPHSLKQRKNARCSLVPRQPEDRCCRPRPARRHRRQRLHRAIQSLTSGRSRRQTHFAVIPHPSKGGSDIMSHVVSIQTRVNDPIAV